MHLTSVNEIGIEPAKLRTTRPERVSSLLTTFFVYPVAIRILFIVSAAAAAAAYITVNDVLSHPRL